MVAQINGKQLAGMAKTEEQISAEQSWYETEKVWLVHKDGFSLANKLNAENSNLPEGKVKIRLENDGTILDVDEDDVEKANPPSHDRVEDLASLVYLNEASVLHTLRQRFGGNLLHTFAGPAMVIMNPMSSLPYILRSYIIVKHYLKGLKSAVTIKEKPCEECTCCLFKPVMHMFKGGRREDTSPHVYGVAQAAYWNMLMTRQDQSIVLLGNSGSGKTTSCQHVIQYLATVSGSTGKIFSAEKWQAVYTILEAFGNSGSSLNGNATRFSQIISLDFDQAGQVASATIQTMLLEKLRVARRPENEATFNAFYYLLAGADTTLRTELHLNHLADNNVFGITSKGEDKQKSAQLFSKLQAAMKILGIAAEEQKQFTTWDQLEPPKVWIFVLGGWQDTDTTSVPIM
ncbi:unnamed protein product [Ranitomeya imitator]|uniref:Myosin motor domain-containing protein n=1 Tax=Ranitomeya imitator TaxID=111125 RepID=A0ABN9MNI6_9NEOB|nr:unnamed protein product [Ranitomeya imitator]